MDLLPKVSIIIPCRNDLRFRRCLEAIALQSYPSRHIEVILVDDGSQPRIDANLPKVTQLRLDEHCGSFAARNSGIRRAKGEVIIFTDSDCVPHRNWIAEGVRAMTSSNCDILGGRIEQVITDPRSASQAVDAINNLRHDLSIPFRSVAFTANLFVRKSVFDAIGTFAEIASGSDSLFVSGAVRSGFSLQYCPAAIVSHSTRSFGELMAKARRIGSAKRLISSPQRQSLKEFSSPHFRNLNPIFLCGQAKQLGIAPCFRLFLGMIVVQWSYVLLLSLHARGAPTPLRRR